MKDARQLLLVLLSSLLLTGCEYRDLLDGYPGSRVQINLNWEGVTDQLPEGVRVIFYPRDAEGIKIDQFLSVTGGELEIPPGRYSVVIYNYDTERVCIRGAEAYETLEAFTELCQFKVAGTAGMVWGPDPLYVVNVPDLEVKNSEDMLSLDFKPALAVKTDSFKLKAEKLENVASMVGSVEGMADHYLIGQGKSMCDANPIYFELGKGDGMIQGSFTTFGIPEIRVTRAEAEVKMTLLLMKVDHTVQKVVVDITATVTAPEPPEGGGAVAPPIEIELPPGEEIVVDDVTPLPDGGGVGGDVGDWEDETEVELPFK